MGTNRKVTYPDDRQLDLTAYLGPRRAGKSVYDGVYGAYPLDPEEGYPSFITDEVFQLYKDAGLNFLMPEGDAYYGKRVTVDGLVDEPDFKKSDLYHYMEVARRNGLDVYPTSEELFHHMSHAEGQIGEHEKAHIKEMVQTLQMHFPDVFRGVMVTDEPSYQEIERVQSIMEYLRSEEICAIKPDLKIFTSMLPIYGALATFGPEYDTEGSSNANAIEDRRRAYQYYIDSCAKAMGEFSFDFYPLQYENRISPWYYMNLEMAAKRCKEDGIPLAATLQSCRFDVFLNEKTGRTAVAYRTPNYFDMRWQVCSALAFGVSRIGYFTFWPHYNHWVDVAEPTAMVMQDPAEEKGYRKTEIYEAVREVHQEITAFDHIFLRFRWQGCMVVRKSMDRNIRNVEADYQDDILKYITASRDLLVGCMENPEDGAKGYWFVNAANPYRYQVNDVEILLKGATRMTYYRKGKEYDIPLEQVTKKDGTYGKWQIRFGVGEGIFAIPY